MYWIVNPEIFWNIKNKKSHSDGNGFKLELILLQSAKTMTLLSFISMVPLVMESTVSPLAPVVNLF